LYLATIALESLLNQLKAFLQHFFYVHFRFVLLPRFEFYAFLLVVQRQMGNVFYAMSRRLYQQSSTESEGGLCKLAMSHEVSSSSSEGLLTIKPRKKVQISTIIALIPYIA